MKKWTALLFALVCMLLPSGCSSGEIDTTAPVFEIECIRSITLFCIPNHTDGVEVPGEYMETITAWIATFTLDKKAGEMLDPCTDTISFRLEYDDGTVVESGVNTTTVDGVTYLMKQDRAPECFDALFADPSPTA